ncbi:MAG: prolipoprotein diacylglyceryl transferase [Planctomycetota bacterium]|nr:prolipoprotein diacylglyceryl transferase [Planctomycetota bacterium]
MLHLLAEIPYPRIDPILLDLGTLKIRWYGVTYVMAFAAAWFVLRDLARRKRWVVKPEKVGDVLFWGILGVFLGGRIGYILFYSIPNHIRSTGSLAEYDWGAFYKVWEGGMSFHGGLAGVVIAYWIWAIRTGTPRGKLFDGLTVATPLGIFFVRMANFINAELWGRPWDGPWAMRFPNYDPNAGGFPPEVWASVPDKPEKWLDELRHPSQLYEGFAEGILLFFVVRWLMLKRGWSNGMVAGAFLFGYGFLRFFIEFTREPDKGLEDLWLGTFSQGQALCVVMVAIGLITIVRGKASQRRERERFGARPK